MQQVQKKIEFNCINDGNKAETNSTKIKIYPKFISENVGIMNKSASKKLKNKKREKVIFGLIRDEAINVVMPVEAESQTKELPVNKKEGRRRKKESSFNTGRWHPEEHQRFIEALLKFGNDWKSVQRYVGSRSSTQARSHAQKFFVKIGKTQIENLQLDFENNSLKSLNIMANNLNNDQMARAIKSLNALAFDKKNSGRKNLKHSKSNEEGGVNNLNTKYEFNFNVEDKDSQFESVHGLIFFNREEKLLNQNASLNDTSVIAIQTFNKRKRIRTLKRRQNSLTKEYVNLRSPSDLPDSECKEEFTRDNNNGNFTLEIEEIKPYHNSSTTALFNIIPPIYQSNRKSSFEFMFPNFNLKEDNPVLICNSTFKNTLKGEEPEFKKFFENSFKFSKINENEFCVHEDHSCILFIDENMSSNSNRRSSMEMEPSDESDKVNDVIGQFMY